MEQVSYRRLSSQLGPLRYRGLPGSSQQTTTFAVAASPEGGFNGCHSKDPADVPAQHGRPQVRP
ncbi:MAG: hypothetical protein QOG25_3069 [Acetobacteraceae bacterium]|jgi:hypothetical protein|nr:hypothetical protein [Acetobacteraceae bacterium]